MQSGDADVGLVWRLVAAGDRVRFDPDVEAAHDTRPTNGGWLGRKFVYGSGGAGLATRHGSKLSPAVLTPPYALAAAALMLRRRWSIPLALTLPPQAHGRMSRMSRMSRALCRLLSASCVRGPFAVRQPQHSSSTSLSRFTSIGTHETDSTSPRTEATSRASRPCHLRGTEVREVAVARNPWNFC